MLQHGKQFYQLAWECFNRVDLVINTACDKRETAETLLADRRANDQAFKGEFVVMITVLK